MLQIQNHLKLLREDFGDLEDSFKGKRFGVFKDIFRDSIFKFTMDKIKEAGGDIVLIAPRKVGLPGFLSILNIEMKHELPKYLKNHADKKVEVTSVKDVITFNRLAPALRAPYGQLQIYEYWERHHNTKRIRSY